MTTVLTPQAIAGGTWTIDTVHSHVGFAVKHMVVSTFRGSFDGYRGELTVGDDGTPRLYGEVDVTSIPLKDENLAAHLQAPDFFDSANHPVMRFTSTEVRVGDDGTLEVDGELEIKGNVRPVT